MQISLSTSQSTSFNAQAEKSSPWLWLALAVLAAGATAALAYGLTHVPQIGSVVHPGNIAWLVVGSLVTLIFIGIFVYRHCESKKTNLLEDPETKESLANKAKSNLDTALEALHQNFENLSDVLANRPPNSNRNLDLCTEQELEQILSAAKGNLETLYKAFADAETATSKVSVGLLLCKKYSGEEPVIPGLTEKFKEYEAIEIEAEAVLDENKKFIDSLFKAQKNLIKQQKSKLEKDWKKAEEKRKQELEDRFSQILSHTTADLEKTKKIIECKTRIFEIFAKSSITAKELAAYELEIQNFANEGLFSQQLAAQYKTDLRQRVAN